MYMYRHMKSVFVALMAHCVYEISDVAACLIFLLLRGQLGVD